MENNASKPPDPEAGQYVATEGELTAQSSFVSDTDGPDVCTKSNVSVIDKETHDRRPSMVWYSDRSDTIQELEQRYIELLRRKIAMFEVEGLENITPHVTVSVNDQKVQRNPFFVIDPFL